MKRMAEPALHDHAIAIARHTVAWLTVNIEAFAAAFQDCARDRKRKFVHHRAIHFSCIQQFLRPAGQIPARNCSCDRRSCRLPIGKEIRRIIWL